MLDLVSNMTETLISSHLTQNIICVNVEGEKKKQQILQDNTPPKCVSDRWMDIHKICCLWPQLPQNGAIKMLMFWFTFNALFNSLKH